MAKSKTIFECSACGYRSAKWMGSCPNCSGWNSFEEIKIEIDKETGNRHRAEILSNSKPSKPQKLNEIEYDENARILTNIIELDRVLGGGFMPGSFILIGGDPGIGKSTLTLQIAKKREDLNILYVSGEESAGQIKQRANRLNVKSEHLLIFTETDLSAIQTEIERVNPDLLIIDSIQTVYRSELQSMPGSVTQIRESASLLMRLSKLRGMTTIVVGHITKDGDLAGPRVLEHMVDTVLMFEGQEHYAYRMLRSSKNRFGAANEIGLFEMTSNGLIDVSNPSKLFLPQDGHNVSGSAIVCTLEGSRPLLIEVQALVTKASYGMPQRTASGFDQRRLSLLLAVLEKRCGYQFGQSDVFVNLVGGIKITEPSADLAICMALISSLTDQSIPRQNVFIGEIGLGAEVRSVRMLDKRLYEAKKMGFTRIILPEMNNEKKIKKSKIELIEVRNLQNAISKFFAKKLTQTD